MERDSNNSPVWANVGVEPDRLGHTLVELWPGTAAVPWRRRLAVDKPERRPSHAYRCQELRREALQYSSLPSVLALPLHSPSASP